MAEIIQSPEKEYPFLPQTIPVTQQQWSDEVPPLVSISCATYMHEDFIRYAIEGFLMQQTNFKIEILIHDDASTDRTADIVREYENKYPKFINATYQIENQFRKNPKTSKFVKSPERKGKYIALCEGDDYWTDPLKLQKQVDFLEAHPDYSLSYCRFQTLNDESGEFQNDQNERYFSKGEEAIDFDFEKIYQGWHLGTQTLVYRKNMFDPSFRSQYKYFKDIHLISHLLLNGKGKCLSFFGAVYRKHKGGIYSGATEFQNSKLSYLCYKEIYEHNQHIHYLKLKYIRFAQNYIDQLLQHNEYKKALMKSIEVLMKKKDLQYFFGILKFVLKHNIKRVLVKLKKHKNESY